MRTLWYMLAFSIVVSVANQLYNNESFQDAEVATPVVVKEKAPVPEVEAEDKNPCTTFVESEYLQINTDVAKAVAEGNFLSGFHHYKKYGHAEGRTTCVITKECFSYVEAEYLELHPDVAQAVVDGVFESGFDHYLKHGESEGRKFCK